MDNKTANVELQDAIYSEDKEILDLVKQCNNELQHSIDSDGERESDSNAVWYYNSEAVESSTGPHTPDWDEYYCSDDWSDYESFNRQVQLERMWNKKEEEEESICSKGDHDGENYDQNYVVGSDDDIEGSEYDWEEMLGSGHWDSNGASPQWVSGELSELVDLLHLSI